MVHLQVLSAASQDIEHTKEIFRCLVLARRSPTLFELALMADLPYEIHQDEAALRAHVVRCGAFVTISDDDSKTVAWIDTAAKEHLETYAKGQLSLELNEVQHGIIALRCLDYVRSNFTVQQEQQNGNEAAVEQEEPAGENGEIAPADGENDLTGSDEPADDETVDEGTENDSNQSHDDVNELAQPLNQSIPPQHDFPEQDQEDEAETESMTSEVSPGNTISVKYPYDFWLEHAKLAEVDVVEEFNLNDDFWSADSTSRAAWWEDYGKIQGFEGLIDTTPLHIAACFGYTALVERLLDVGMADYKAMDSWGYGPLYWACYDGQIDIVQRLVKAGADVNMHRGGGNITALWIAASQGFLEITQYLLEQNAMTDFGEDDLGTPLYIASENGRVPVVRHLIEHGADVNMIGGLHRRPLNAAAFSGDLETISLLLGKNIDIDPDDEYRYGSALGAAARKGHDNIVRLLIQKGWNVNKTFKHYHSALVAAATYGHVDVVKVLLMNNVDAKSRQLSLEVASMNGKTQVVEEILINSNHLQHQKAFLKAASHGCNDVLRLLQKLGTNPEMLNTALYQASDAEQNSTVELLLEFGADPNAEGEE